MKLDKLMRKSDISWAIGTLFAPIGMVAIALTVGGIFGIL